MLPPPHSINSVPLLYRLSRIGHQLWGQRWTGAAAAKSFQSCPTLCDPMDSSPPGSSVHGILQARILEWVAVSFSKRWTGDMVFQARTNTSGRDGIISECSFCFYFYYFFSVFILYDGHDLPCTVPVKHLTFPP